MSQKNNIDLSIIIPALNESAVIADTLKSIHEVIQKDLKKHSIEVIVVAAQDLDNTAEIASESKDLFEHFLVINPDSRVGKGRDVALGMMAAKGKVNIFTDADLAIPTKNIKPMFSELYKAQSAGSELALFGSRTKKHGSIIRKFFSFASSLTTRVLFFSSLHDTQCGFKGFTAGAAQVAFSNLKTQGWAFDSEVYMRLKKAHIPVKPFTITKWSADTHHLGGQNMLKASVISFIELVRIRLQSFFY